MPIRPSCRRALKGFTLVELMIVVALVAIMAALAMPSYESYMRKARRTDAKNALLDLAIREEKFFSIHNRYSTSAADLGYPSLPHAVASSGRGSFYALSLAGDASSYTAKATPTGAQMKDTQCYAFTLMQSGLRGNRNAGGEVLPAAPCW